MSNRWRPTKYYNIERNLSHTSLAEFKYYNSKHQILTPEVIKNIEEQLKVKDKVYYTNKQLADKALGLIFKNISDDEKEVVIYILKATDKINVEEYNKCVHITSDNLGLQFDLNMIQENILKELSSERQEFFDTLTIIKTWEELVTRMITTLLIEKIVGVEQDSMNKFLEELHLNCKVDKKFEVVNKTNSEYMTYVEKVVEKRINNTNYRIAVIARIDYSNPEYSLKVYSENHIHYNYIDEGRIIIKGNNKNDYFLPLECIEYYEKNILFNMDLYRSISRDVHELTGNNVLITQTIYNFYKERENRQDRSWTPKNDLERQIIAQYVKVLDEGRGVKIGNVLINSTSIEIQSENFKLEFTEDFLKVKEYIGRIRSDLIKEDIRYNANAFYEKLLEMSSTNILKMNNTHDTKYKEFKETEFTINGMLIKIKKDDNRLFINDIFSRIDDLYYILTKAICYFDVREYEKYIKEVSYIGIEWERLISNGVLITVIHPYKSLFTTLGHEFRDEVPIRLSFKWDEKHRTKIYLFVNNKEYFIESKIKFKKWFNKPQITIDLRLIITRLKEAIPSLTTEDVIELIDYAEIEGQIIQKRGLELVQNIIKDTNTKEGVIDVSGNTIEGYNIIGRVSKSKFFIKKNSLDVYKYVNGQWNRRCVVDDHSKHRIYEDRLANRIANIYNELAKITTIHNT